MADMDKKVAFCGEVELINASWSLDEGRRVELRLTGDAYTRVHPFKRFQQRRAGRMGARFGFTCADSKTGNIFIAQCEVMLAGWKDSSYGGQQITLWLDDEADRHPFAGYGRRKNGVPGDMFAIALLEINDDEQPVDEEQRANVERAAERGSDPGAAADIPPNGASSDSHMVGGGRQGVRQSARSGGSRPASRKLSAQAHLMVTSKMFVRWLEETKPLKGRTWTPELARRWAKREIQVESLSELDQKQAARDLFERLVRKPYARWNNQEPD